MRFVFCLFFPVLLVPASGPYAQSANFEKITIENGLSQGMIHDILQTRDGFLWVATKDGLNRYDGYNFKVFSNNSFDSLSIASNTATTLFEDSRNLLWIGLEGKGVDVYDPQTGHFHHIPIQFEANKEAPFLRIQSISQDANDVIWVLCGRNKLMRITISGQRKDLADWSKQVEITEITPEAWEKGKENLICFSMEDNGGAILFSNTRQFRVEAGSNVAKPLRNVGWPGSVQYVIPNAANSPAGWWLLDKTYRLYWLDDKGLVVVQPQIQESKQQANLELDSWGRTWLTLDNRIWQLGDGARTIDLQKPDWILDREATNVQSDHNGNIWVGTSGYGLRKINPGIRLFNAGAAGQSIWRLWRSPQGRYYARKGLIKLFPYDPGMGILGKNPAFPELGDKGTRDICFEPSGAFWLLASHSEAYAPGGFLCRFDASETLEQLYPFDFNGYDHARLFLDREGYVWATGARCQLVRFDPRTARFDYFDYSNLFGKNAETVQPLDIVQDGNGVLWIGTQQGLIKCFRNGQNLDFQLIQTDPRNPGGLNHNSIACLLPDPVHPDAALWIGTKGGGINCLDLRSGRFRHFTIADDFPDQVVYGILPGNENPAVGPVSLWCSTNRGLVKVTPRGTPPFSFDLVRYSAAQGLQDEEFNTQSYFKAANGELLFGGVNGLNHFFPEKLSADTTAPPVFIVGLEINHQRADVRNAKHPLAMPLEHLGKLELRHDQDNVSFEFAALDFTDPSKNRYRYRLVGLDADWVETGNHRFAHFSHLAPGRYELRVQGSNGESAWNEAQSLIVVVHPPWYRSDLAYLCYVLFLAWGGWRVYQFQIRRVKEREQLAFEKRETERVKTLEQMKTNFFSNVTHELRTPLTLIIEPLRQFLKNPKDPGGIENVRLAERNSRQLLNLINQLLDLAKFESGQMSLDLRRTDLGQTVRDVFETFLPLAEKRGVKLVFRQDLQNLQDVECDPGKVELVLNNLIVNALKFTKKGGLVEISCQEGIATATLPDGQSLIRIIVRDTGIGIAPEHLDKIFDRFYQVDGSNTRQGEGTGIGLALSKELAVLMGGGIEVESEVGIGSTFTFWLPIQAGAQLPAPEALPVSAPEYAARQWPASRPAPNSELPVALIVEDQDELRGFIRQSIEGAWQVAEASNGEEGIKKAVELLPDLVISDVMMPVKSGYELCDELKTNELTAHIPIILLTAKSAIASKLMGLRTGADDYLTKPFNTEELLARMENLVALRRSLREFYSGQPIKTAVEASDNLSAFDRDFLKKFTSLLENHLSDETLGVEDFSQKMFLSRSQLHRKLKAVTGRNATDFIREYRLEQAHALLQQGGMLVAEVAMQVGFSNEKYFSTVFREKYGASPSQLIKR